MSAIDKEPFPRFALYVAAGIMAVSIAAAASARYAAVNAPAVDAETLATPLTSRILHFSDAPDGSVRVQNADRAITVAVLAPGTNGFIRGVVRGLARDRHLRGISDEQAFRLAQWPDGRLSLDDLATGKRIELSAFGSTNRAAFAQILAASEEARS